MNGRIAKKIRRSIGGQELSGHRRYYRKDGTRFLTPDTSRVLYKMEKAYYKNGGSLD